jgi:3alpha(or 20beta)-hydroxysteroid dehydrogenase
MTTTTEARGRLAGRTALVTGAARGTGEAIARRFVAEGARVILTDVRDDAGERVTKELGRSARYRHLDVSSESDWAETIESIRNHEGGLDVLVNNAAILLLRTIDETTAEDFERILRVNTLGPFLGTRAALPLLREAATSRGTASIINVGSTDSLSGTTTTSAYSASKFGLAGLTRVTALENGKYGVRANTLCPRAGSAEMQLEQFGSDAGRDVSNEPSTTYDPEYGPLGRRGLPEDVAPAAVFLASEESAFITGTELLIDGGMQAGEYVDVPGRFSRLR